MILKINNQTKSIPAISKLNFEQFNNIIVKKEVYDLKEYISLFLDMSVDELMNSKINSSSIEAIHAGLFDVDIEKTIKTPPNTFSFGEQIYIVEELSLDTFGKTYIFDLYLESFRSNKLNYYELSLYCLACHLSNSFDMSEIDNIYKKLTTFKWGEVLPTAFFLLKRSLKKKKGFTRLLIPFIAELKRTRLQSLWMTKPLSNSAKKLLVKRWLLYSDVAFLNFKKKT